MTNKNSKWNLNKESYQDVWTPIKQIGKDLAKDYAQDRWPLLTRTSNVFNSKRS